MSRNGLNNKGGRPPGRKNEATLEREAVQNAFNQRVFRIADSLLSSQASLAKGQQFLFRIDTVHTKGPRGGDVATKQKPVIVTDPEEIAAYLDSIDNPNSYVDPDQYYYITTVAPNNMAADSLLNRAFGRPKETVEVTMDTKIQVDF